MTLRDVGLVIAAAAKSRTRDFEVDAMRAWMTGELVRVAFHSPKKFPAAQEWLRKLQPGPPRRQSPRDIRAKLIAWSLRPDRKKRKA